MPLDKFSLVKNKGLILAQSPQWLGEDPAIFPSSNQALDDPNGLIAIGGDLSPARILNAYARGIFPWFNEDQPILWWTPTPRMVFFPGEVHASKSLRKHLRKYPVTVSIDRNFPGVIQGCQAPRSNQTAKGHTEAGTWISPDIREAYTDLYALGFAHSIEVWSEQNHLIGGLYGIALGPVFFGESMFSYAPNTSKIAIWTLSNWAKANGFQLIDCQIENKHLKSLGGQTISRVHFETYLPKSESLIQQFQHIWQRVRGSVIYSHEMDLVS